mmetsp:Transcript_62227/g.190071  ORF Transcript_62227/g.190071 Transcript_62227/m.190071 type:complete len:241 (-) Transcript_62227:396-1118(-)
MTPRPQGLPSLACKSTWSRSRTSGKTRTPCMSATARAARRRCSPALGPRRGCAPPPARLRTCSAGARDPADGGHARDAEPRRRGSRRSSPRRCGRCRTSAYDKLGRSTAPESPQPPGLRTFADWQCPCTTQRTCQTTRRAGCAPPTCQTTARSAGGPCGWHHGRQRSRRRARARPRTPRRRHRCSLACPALPARARTRRPRRARGAGTSSAPSRQASPGSCRPRSPTCSHAAHTPRWQTG